MTQAEINAQLRRPIKNGHQYDALFPDSSCQVTRLGKGNTAVALNNMAKWSKKYAHQSKEIAPVLQGDTLEQTCVNIHSFIYNHFQYAIDGADQNLKSPACAWHSRAEGMDCKSYSILASTILLNLGIKHYLRRIKQAGHYPEAYTHVYVIVPINQKTASLNQGYFTIDGTIPNTNELDYLKKDDKRMEPALPIYGLASPKLAGAGKNLSGAVDYQTALENFAMFLNNLKSMGELTSQQCSDAIDKAIMYVQNGIDPYLKQVMPQVSQGALGMALNADSSSNGSSDANSEINAEEVKDFISQVSDFFENTFGDFFENIFSDPSCINSTYNEKDTRDLLIKYHVPYVSKLLAQLIYSNENNIEKNLNEIEYFLANHNKIYWELRINTANWRRCSRKALDVYTGYYRILYGYIEHAIIPELSEYFNISKTQFKDKIFKPEFENNTDIDSVVSRNQDFYYNVYNLIPKGNNYRGITLSKPIKTDFEYSVNDDFLIDVINKLFSEIINYTSTTALPTTTNPYNNTTQLPTAPSTSLFGGGTAMWLLVAAAAGTWAYNKGYFNTKSKK
jgi:hypothetical protein